MGETFIISRNFKKCVNIWLTTVLLRLNSIFPQEDCFARFLPWALESVVQIRSMTDVGDLKLMTEVECWCPRLMEKKVHVDDHNETVTKFYSCQQIVLYSLCPTSVTNIDVTDKLRLPACVENFDSKFQSQSQFPCFVSCYSSKLLKEWMGNAKFF